MDNETLYNRILRAADAYANAVFIADIGASHQELLATADIADKAEALADALLCVDVTFGGRKADVERARIALDAWLAIERAPRIDRE